MTAIGAASRFYQVVMKTSKKIFWIIIFAIAFAFVESTVVLYLRGLYYPEGFALPLKPIDANRLGIELVRELATILLLVAVGMLTGRTAWNRFGYFMIAFGLWDIFYYVWLKVSINWPASILDWDVLFLIPLPWIGPVVAPAMISVLMVIAGLLIIRQEEGGNPFHPPRSAWVLCVLGTIFILYSFMRDTNATLHFQTPEPYRWELFGIGTILYVAAILLSFPRRQ